MQVESEIQRTIKRPALPRVRGGFRAARRPADALIGTCGAPEAPAGTRKSGMELQTAAAV
eukprot:7732258-Alexandrium_andersonii.AAC.1